MLKHVNMTATFTYSIVFHYRDICILKIYFVIETHCSYFTFLIIVENFATNTLDRSCTNVWRLTYIDSGFLGYSVCILPSLLDFAKMSSRVVTCIILSPIVTTIALCPICTDIWYCQYRQQIRVYALEFWFWLWL